MYIQKLTVLLLVNQFLNGLAQYRTSIKYDEPSYDMDLYVDSEIDMKSTYRSPIEKFLQGLMTTLRTQQSTGIAERIIYSLPDPLKSLFVGNQDGDGGRSFGDVLNAFQDDFQAIFPGMLFIYLLLTFSYTFVLYGSGTLWCGRGNAAVSGDAVGIFAQSDMCCRQHDNCPYSIEAGRNFGLLKNNGIFTRFLYNSITVIFYIIINSGSNYLK